MDVHGRGIPTRIDGATRAIEAFLADGFSELLGEFLAPGGGNGHATAIGGTARKVGIDEGSPADRAIGTIGSRHGDAIDAGDAIGGVVVHVERLVEVHLVEKGIPTGIIVVDLSDEFACFGIIEKVSQVQRLLGIHHGVVHAVEVGRVVGCPVFHRFDEFVRRDTVLIGRCRRPGTFPVGTAKQGGKMRIGVEVGIFLIGIEIFDLGSGHGIVFDALIRRKGKVHRLKDGMGISVDVEGIDAILKLIALEAILVGIAIVVGSGIVGIEGQRDGLAFARLEKRRLGKVDQDLVGLLDSAFRIGKRDIELDDVLAGDIAGIGDLDFDGHFAIRSEVGTGDCILVFDFPFECCVA